MAWLYWFCKNHLKCALIKQALSELEQKLQWEIEYVGTHFNKY